MEESLNIISQKNNKEEFRLNSIMSSQNYRLYVDDDISFALIKLDELNINYINVFDSNDEVVGTLNRDSIDLQRDQTVMDCMDRDFLIVSEKKDYKILLVLLLRLKKKCAVIKRGSQVVGNFSVDNIYKCGDI